MNNPKPTQPAPASDAPQIPHISPKFPICAESAGTKPSPAPSAHAPSPPTEHDPLPPAQLSSPTQRVNRDVGPRGASPAAPINDSDNQPHSTNNDQPTELTDRQLSALNLMLQGATDVDISTELRIDRKTLYNWRTHHPAFRAELHRRRDDLLAHSSDRLRALLSAALDTLDQHVHDPYTPTSHRAARTLLSLSRVGHLLVPPARATRARDGAGARRPDAGDARDVPPPDDP